MRTDDREAQLAAAYSELHRRLMALLYDEDPGGMGSTVGAPLDEYAQETSALIVRLKEARSREDVRRVLTTMFPGASESLATQVHTEWGRFVASLAADA